MDLYIPTGHIFFIFLFRQRACLRHAFFLFRSTYIPTGHILFVFFLLSTTDLPTAHVLPLSMDLYTYGTHFITFFLGSLTDLPGGGRASPRWSYRHPSARTRGGSPKSCRRPDTPDFHMHMHQAYIIPCICSGKTPPLQEDETNETKTRNNCTANGVQYSEMKTRTQTQPNMNTNKQTRTRHYDP